MADGGRADANIADAEGAYHGTAYPRQMPTLLKSRACTMNGVSRLPRHAGETRQAQMCRNPDRPRDGRSP